MRRGFALSLGILLFLGSATTFTDDGGSGRIRVTLSGYEETPLALSTPGNGRFAARISQDQTKIQWELSYGDLESNATQSHIHFGARGQTGGVSIFLCTNLGNGPVGTQACPATGTNGVPLTGVATAADVVGPTGQGIAAGEFAEVIAAIRAGTAYVNVHSVIRAGGEIRAQFPPAERAEGHDHHH